MNMKKNFLFIFVIYFLFITSGCQSQTKSPILHYIPPGNSPFKIEFDYPGSWEVDEGPNFESGLIFVESVPKYKMGLMDYLTFKPSPTPPVSDVQEVIITLVPDIKNSTSFKEQVIEFTKPKNGAPGVIDFKLEPFIIKEYPAYRESWINLKTPLYNSEHDLYKEMVYLYVGNQMIIFSPVISDIHDNPTFAQGYHMIIDSIKPYQK
jgi:hypothetical protein